MPASLLPEPQPSSSHLGTRSDICPVDQSFPNTFSDAIPRRGVLMKGWCGEAS